MELIRLFKEFHSKAVEQEFPTSARVLYYTLLGEFNAAYWKDELVFSERELSRLSGLGKTSVNSAKKFLSDHGFIKIVKKNSRDRYILKSDRSATTARPAGDRYPTAGRPPVYDYSMIDFDKENIKDKKDRAREGGKTYGGKFAGSGKRSGIEVHDFSGAIANILNG